MAQSTVGIVNLGLLRIGANVITSLTENSPNAIKVNAVFSYLLNEVLQARDWRFAKTRLLLQLSTTTPDYAYRYAYALPPDFLRLRKPVAPPSIGRNSFAESFWPTGSFKSYDYDPPVYPAGHPYVIETLPADGSLYLLTNYFNSDVGLYINYIKMVTDPTKWTPAFCTCLADRIAAEMAIPITEDKQKAQMKMQDYKESLYSAEAVNESLDFLSEEAGGNDWIEAGRSFWGG